MEDFRTVGVCNPTWSRVSHSADGKEALYAFKERLEFGASATTTGPTIQDILGRAYNLGIHARFQPAG